MDQSNNRADNHGSNSEKIISNQHSSLPSLNQEQDCFQSINENSNAPKQRKKRPRQKAVILTDPEYKENLVQEKLRNIKKEKKEPAVKRQRKAKPKIISEEKSAISLSTIQSAGVQLLPNTLKNINTPIFISLQQAPITPNNDNLQLGNLPFLLS